ncbi:MAG TPA: hypothetical protein VM681_11035 [Candidatus Thermoplasmatota archaeon]|nr:hypothetical protein [Candidatus Thermoplasmatota archaeon]
MIAGDDLTLLRERFDRHFAGAGSKVRVRTVGAIEVEGEARCAHCERVVTGTVARVEAGVPVSAVGATYHVCPECVATIAERARRDVPERQSAGAPTGSILRDSKLGLLV